MLVRVDLNVPVEDGKVTDATRIERVAPTIRELSDKGAKVILLAHFGRPKDGPIAEFSLEPIAQATSRMHRPAGRLRRRLHRREGRRRRRRHEGRRHPAAGKHPLPQGRGEERRRPSPKTLAANGDIFVNDAFSAAHRAHASTEGLAHLLPAFAGRTMQAELEALEKGLGNPKRPVVAIVGGAKVSTKIDLLMNLVKKVDALVIGGGMANTFLAARGTNVGKSLCEHDLADTAKQIMIEAATAGCAIVLPSTASSPGNSRPGAANEVVDDRRVPADAHDPRRRPEDGRSQSTTGSSAPTRWSGTARSAPSRSRPSTRRRSRPPSTPPRDTKAGGWSRSPAAAIRSRR